jgi:hypothetical protein
MVKIGGVYYRTGQGIQSLVDEDTQFNSMNSLGRPVLGYSFLI